MEPTADDVHAVLRHRSIADVQKLLEVTRRSKEAKEKEMQAMGGSRYHDLIESADQIVSMHDASRRLEVALSDMPRLWKLLEKSVQVVVETRGAEEAAPFAPPADVSVAVADSDVHFVVTASERMWAAMERGHPLEAWNILEQVESTTARLSPETLHELGFLALDIEALADFPATIRRCAIECLAVPKQGASFFADALEALHRLEATPLPDLLDTFLRGRTTALESVAGATSAFPTTSALRVIHVVLGTIAHAHALFLDPSRPLLPAASVPTAALEAPITTWIATAVEQLRRHVESLLTSGSDVAALGKLQARVQRVVEKYAVPLPLVVAALPPAPAAPSNVWAAVLEDLFVHKTQAIFRGSLEAAGARLRQALVGQPSDADVVAFIDTLAAMHAQAAPALHPVLLEGSLRLVFGLLGFVERAVAAEVRLVHLCLALQTHSRRLFPADAAGTSPAPLGVAAVRTAFDTHATERTVPTIALSSIFAALQLPAATTLAIDAVETHATLPQVYLLVLLQMPHVSPSTAVASACEALAQEVASVWAGRIVEAATLPLTATLQDQYYGYSNEEWRRVHRQFWAEVAVPQDDDDDSVLEHVWLPWSETPAISHALFALQASIPLTKDPIADGILKAQVRAHVLGWTHDVLAARVAALAAAKPAKPPLDFGQACALQSIFDVYFVRLCIGDSDFTRFGWGDTIAHAGLQALVVALVTAWIDPVDWELFGPPLTANVVAQFQTSRLLLSGLATTSVVAPAPAAPRTTLAVELAPPAPRFALLPVPTAKAAPRLPTPVHIRPPSPKRSSIHSLLSTSGSSLLGSAAAAKGMSLLSSATSYLQPKE
ncbi:hypothetical protein ACHHYP_15025 [Achlya hypogyna]|uniref:Conserved oligomeric Golgi complex subunit 1 n=1 Tax=Achlya hypogyna TaxID=1202772 RepID=A0A1V9YBS7_ACHHY|nr:hypothetical protein ACHHYP_15025 [Achlya hypogyna]